MDNNTQSLNQGYVDQLYSKYLAKRYGINSCVAIQDFDLMDGQKILSDRSNYMDISSPNLQDQTLMLNVNKPTWVEYISSLPNTSVSSNQYVVPIAPISCSVINPPAIFHPIEVIVGSPQAIVLNILAETTTIYNLFFFNQYVEVFRNNINLPSIDPQTGDGYFTKDFSSYTITLSNVLKTGEIIKIKIIT